MSLGANTYTVEYHSTVGLWVADRGCGCAECPKGIGKTKGEAVSDLEDFLKDVFTFRFSAQSGNDRAQNGQTATSSGGNDA